METPGRAARSFVFRERSRCQGLLTELRRLYTVQWKKYETRIVSQSWCRIPSATAGLRP